MHNTEESKLFKSLKEGSEHSFMVYYVPITVPESDFLLLTRYSTVTPRERLLTPICR